MMTSFIDVDFTLKLWFHTTSDSTLMNYYEDRDYYKPHHDKSCYTYVFWLFKEPRYFDGGNLTFSDINYTINTKSNMGVLFPSWALHAVDEIKMNYSVPKYQGYGRFSFSTFFHIK
jgi:Rps23 Pro-64 3,4-dihydroxylase Tpa1-like proline 4-hydroxylase